MSTQFDEKNRLIKMYEKKGLHKGSVIDVLGDFVIEDDFAKVLDGFLNEYVERRSYSGVVYSDEFDEEDEEYFGENKILFYYGIGEEAEDIVTYEELCEYLKTACEFYIEKYPEQASQVEKLFLRIKDKYNIKE